MGELILVIFYGGLTTILAIFSYVKLKREFKVNENTIQKDARSE